MKALQTIQALSLFGLLTLGTASCNSSDESNQPYTPLQVYFDPVRVDMNMEELMPYFVNYPTDWAKMGLRGYPKQVSYDYHNAAWGVTYTSQYEFLSNGRLSEQRRTSFNVGASGFDVISYEYDSRSNLTLIKSVYDGRYKRRYKDNGFVYDSAGRLVRREKDQGGNPGTWNYLYEYHRNGTLKSILPEKERSLATEAGVTLYKLRFDSLAHLQSFETPNTPNLFLKGIDGYKMGKSVTTYTYTGHMCTQAVEKMPVQFDQGTETLTATSSFTYNSHGDLASWTYNGGVYKSSGNSWRVDDMKFTISYEYVYDEQGNWTQATVTFPANIDEIPALRTYYKATRYGFTSNQDRSPSVKPGETPTLTVARTISYWDEETIASQKTVGEGRQSAQAETLRYKGTDIYGLNGVVKSVKSSENSYKFDQAGNLIFKEDFYNNGPSTYKYITPTSYKLDSWDDVVVNITIEDGKRSDICSDASTNTELDQVYTFDKRNRITSHKFTSYMAYVTHTYSYKGDSKYPATMVEKHSADGTTTYHYTYTKFDKQKNWIERKVSCANSEEYTEKRTIEYW